jgi:predicted RND superfamily exporter protein
MFVRKKKLRRRKVNKLEAYRYRLTKLFRVHQSFVILLLVLVVLVAVFYRVKSLNDLPVDQAYMTQEMQKLKAVKFNEEAIEQIKALRDSNVATPGTDLPKNRQNPFAE